MSSETAREIVEWSRGRPLWQQDALRRLLAHEKLSAEDTHELARICKAQHGLAEPSPVDVLESKHLPISATNDAPIELASVHHHSGVNALARDQRLSFRPGLNVVYGPNAAGKSGYARVLKHACRARASEEILADVLTDNKPQRAQVTVNLVRGGAELPFEWHPGVTPSEDLAKVSVFDADCAPVYLGEKTDVAFRPFGIDLFDRLAHTCSDVRRILEEEQRVLNERAGSLPNVPEGTRVHALLQRLTALTSLDDVRSLARLSQEEEARLNTLRKRNRDAQSTAPEIRASELEQRARRMNALTRHARRVGELFGPNHFTTVRDALHSLEAARRALEHLRSTTLTSDLLPGTGTQTWNELWQAAREFSLLAYPTQTFPVLHDGARCPLCQRELTPDTATRLDHLRQYFESDAQEKVRATEANALPMKKELLEFPIDREELGDTITELEGDSTELAQAVRDLLSQARSLQSSVNSAGEDLQFFPASTVESSGVTTSLEQVAHNLHERAQQLRTRRTSMSDSELHDLSELSAREKLRAELTSVENEIERLQRVNAYRQCLRDTNTRAITQKGSELTKRLVTEQLRHTFQLELDALDFTHLSVELQPVGGSRGTLYHRLTFQNAPGVALTRVLSEGESRTLSLAAFLTELSTADTDSAIVFDDPVSSLDHHWRERIARRLVREANSRQVVIFTHDILFLHYLLERARADGLTPHHQYVRREGKDSGLCSTDLPWIATKTKDRIGVLNRRLQDAQRIFRAQGRDAYEPIARELYGLLREAWEHAVGEVLLNDVIERYRHSIETNKARVLYDIRQEDCTVLEAEVAECSRWIRGHDQPPAENAPVPDPSELNAHIKRFSEWVGAINKRRN